ncbi:MAG: hypothetical protein HYU57_06935 [Micavibrio aeruginosavorus]|nr:hypothetical protein [Micavibrio aeruginosavorus]
MNKLNPTFNDFADAEKVVAAVHEQIEANVTQYGKAAGFRGPLMDEFNRAYDDMVVTAFHLKLRGGADPVRAADMSRRIERWLPIREKCELAK